MNDTSELYGRPFMCPYHGRIPREYVTTIKTCGRCMEERDDVCAAGDSTLLIRWPYEGHKPRYRFDCAQCKFAWCCGPGCACVLPKTLPETPKERQVEVKQALLNWRKRRGMTPHVDWEECR